MDVKGNGNAKVELPSAVNSDESNVSLTIDEASNDDVNMVSTKAKWTGIFPSDQYLDALDISVENKNTQRKTDTDIRILISYLKSVSENRSPETISPMELDKHLSTFFDIVKKHDGNDYEPASLRGMLCSIERYLKMKNYPASVTRDFVFASTRRALKAKQQTLRESGKTTKKPPECGVMTFEKVKQLYGAREMGPYTPMSVINSLCFTFIVHFHLRKAIDHKNLLWGDVKLMTDKNGREFLAYEPRCVGKPKVLNIDSENSFRLCVWSKSENVEKDPIKIYKLYAEKRPSEMNTDNAPFYLGITTLYPSAMQPWYRTCAMGVNKLSDLVRMLREFTGIAKGSLQSQLEIFAENAKSSITQRSEEKGEIGKLPPASSTYQQASQVMASLQNIYFRPTNDAIQDYYDDDNSSSPPLSESDEYCQDDVTQDPPTSTKETAKGRCRCTLRKA